MVTNKKTQQQNSIFRVLVVGNYCHDVLIQNGNVIAESLGGAVSFISNVFNGLSVAFHLVSKVGYDFKYTTNDNDTPIVIPTSKTTVFKAFFDSGFDGNGHKDRVLKRVCTCDPIMPVDLPEGRFDYGMVVGVGGEILPDTVEKMIDICDVVFVDIQALIRVFDSSDGGVNLVELKDSGFYHLLPRIGVLKASSEEAVVMDVDEVSKFCCVVVTNGKDGCEVCWKDGEMKISPFVANQVDPTGAGDSFLGGLVAGLVQGLAVPDAALMGNFFGSLTVEQIGLPKFDLRLLQRVRHEVQRRTTQCISCHARRDDELKFIKPAGHEQFHASLAAAKHISTCTGQECQWDLPSSPPKAAEQGILPHYNGQPRLLLKSVYEEPIKTVEGVNHDTV